MSANSTLEYEYADSNFAGNPAPGEYTCKCLVGLVRFIPTLRSDVTRKFSLPSVVTLKCPSDPVSTTSASVFPSNILSANPSPLRPLIPSAPSSPARPFCPLSPVAPVSPFCPLLPVSYTHLTLPTKA